MRTYNKFEIIIIDILNDFIDPMLISDFVFISTKLKEKIDPTKLNMLYDVDSRTTIRSHGVREIGGEITLTMTGSLELLSQFIDIATLKFNFIRFFIDKPDYKIGYGGGLDMVTTIDSVSMTFKFEYSDKHNTK